MRFHHWLMFKINSGFVQQLTILWRFCRGGRAGPVRLGLLFLAGTNQGTGTRTRKKTRVSFVVRVVFCLLSWGVFGVWSFCGCTEDTPRLKVLSAVLLTVRSAVAR